MMTAHGATVLRSRLTLRARMIGGLTLAGLFILLAIAFFLWQMMTMRSALMELQVQSEWLTLTMDTAHTATDLVVIVLDRLDDRVPARFVQDVGASVRALQARQDDLRSRGLSLSPGDPMRDRVEALTTSLQYMINNAEGAIRNVEGENWPEAGFRAGVLLEGHDDVKRQSSQVVTLARERYTSAAIQMAQVMQRMLSGSVVLTAIALIVAGLVTAGTVRSVTARVGALGYAAQRLAEGHFDERVPAVTTDELGRLAATFNTMAAELQALYTSLEQRVAQRTRELERRGAQLAAAAEVAREAAAIQDMGRLLEETVRLISDRFGFYHAGIFLVDEAGEYALLQAASSEGGQQMLARGYKLAVGKVGIVGHVAGSGEARIALDVGQDAVYFDNPDLPLTRSEIALPLKVRGRVMGVLDVQSTEAAAFTEDDVAVLQTLADQVALAIENARLLEEGQRTLRELETLYGQRLRQAWRERVAYEPTAYRYTRTGVEPASSPESLGEQHVTSPLESVPGEGDGHTLVARINLRGQTLGSIVLRRDPEQEPWSPEEIALVEEVSTQVGLALENARLLEVTRRRAARDRLIADITARVRSAMDPEIVLQTAVRELGAALDTDRVVAQLSRATPAPSKQPGSTSDESQSGG